MALAKIECEIECVASAFPPPRAAKVTHHARGAGFLSLSETSMAKSRCILNLIKLEFAQYTGVPFELVPDHTRIDEYMCDELAVIEFVDRVENVCGRDIPDYEIASTMTLAQFALLIEMYATAPRRDA